MTKHDEHTVTQAGSKADGLSRRQFIKQAGATTAAFTIVPRHVLGGANYTAPSDKLTIDVNDVIENGAVVPLAIKSGLPNVHSITILVEKNPNPLIANFKLHPLCQGFIETRIKMGESSDIIAVIRADDQLYSTRKFVEVIAGGCG